MPETNEILQKTHSYTYKIVEDEDGNHYVSIKELQDDIYQSIKHLNEIDDDRLTDEDHEILFRKQMSLVAVYEFVGALMQEVTLRKAAENLKKNDSDIYPSNGTIQ